MNDSFAKIGYIAREDTKKYFDESSARAVEIFAQSSEENKRIVSETMSLVLQDSLRMVKETVASAEKEASGIIAKANEESENIKKEAKVDSERYFNSLISEATQAVDWAMEQYIKQEFTYKNHEDLINSLIEVYINEHRRY
jgi:F0F1-type ATP synthase membrane subunit b/b'